MVSLDNVPVEALVFLVEVRRFLAPVDAERDPAGEAVVEQGAGILLKLEPFGKKCSNELLKLSIVEVERQRLDELLGWLNLRQDQGNRTISYDPKSTCSR